MKKISRLYELKVSEVTKGIEEVALPRLECPKIDFTSTPKQPEYSVIRVEADYYRDIENDVLWKIFIPNDEFIGPFNLREIVKDSETIRKVAAEMGVQGDLYRLAEENRRMNEYIKSLEYALSAERNKNKKLQNVVIHEAANER